MSCPSVTLVHIDELYVENKENIMVFVKRSFSQEELQSICVSQPRFNIMLLHNETSSPES